MGITLFIPRTNYPRRYDFYGRGAVSNDVGPLAPRSIATTYSVTGGNNMAERASRVTFFNNSFATISESCVISLLRTTGPCVSKKCFNKVEVSAHPSTVSSRELRVLGGCRIASVRLNTRDVSSSILGVGQHNRATGSIRGTSHLVGDCNFSLKLRVVAKLVNSASRGYVGATRELVTLSPSAIEVCPAVILRGAPLTSCLHSNDCETRALGRTIDLYTELLLVFQRGGVGMVHLNLRDNKGMSRNCLTNTCRPTFHRLYRNGVCLRGVLSRLSGLPGSVPCIVRIPRGSVKGTGKRGGEGRGTLLGGKFRYGVGNGRFLGSCSVGVARSVWEGLGGSFGDTKGTKIWVLPQWGNA